MRAVGLGVGVGYSFKTQAVVSQADSLALCAAVSHAPGMLKPPQKYPSPTTCSWVFWECLKRISYIFMGKIPLIKYQSAF